MKEPIDFTYTEQFILKYYRDAKRVRFRRLTYDGSYLTASLACLAWYYFKQDVAIGFVGYVILLWRVASDMFRSQQYNEPYQSIFAKYEARVKELNEKLEKSKSDAA